MADNYATPQVGLLRGHLWTLSIIYPVGRPVLTNFRTVRIRFSNFQ